MTTYHILDSNRFKDGTTILAMYLDPPYCGVSGYGFPYVIALEGSKGVESSTHLRRFMEHEWDMFVETYATNVKNQSVTRHYGWQS